MIIFKTWGLVLLYLLWFWSFSFPQFARFGNPCMYLSIYRSFTSKFTSIEGGKRVTG